MALSEPLIDTPYRFPWDRQKTRKATSYDVTGALGSDSDAVGEIYDYLIIFTKHDNDGIGGLVEQEGWTTSLSGSHEPVLERISWKDIQEIWFQAVSGDEDRKNKGVLALRSEWLGRFRTDTVSAEQGGDSIPKLTFQSLVREHIVDVLGRRAGLSLKLVMLSETSNYVYCLVRAPTSLLEKKADVDDYKLKFKDEVDPGFEFWQKKEGYDERNQPIYVELIEEASLYSKNEANEFLEDLFGARKITANDAAIFDVEEPTKRHWSRRVHTLERIADRVPTSNRYPAYSGFSLKPHLRHLYAEYPSNRGKTLFLSKDRLYLTKAILDEHFDFGVLVENDIVAGCFALHDASYGEDVTRSWLKRHWALPFWYSTRQQCGAPQVSHPAIEHGTACPLLVRPWAQPLMEVRAYFGEKIAMYFAWVGYYGFALLWPAVAAIACELYLLVTRQSDESGMIHIDQIALGFFIVYWAARYKVSWDVEEKYCALKWGTVNFEEEEVDRPQFQGDVDQPRRLSPITYQNETFYPEEKRSATQCMSAFLILLAVAFLLAVVLAIFEVQYIVYEAGLKIVAELFPILQSIFIQLCSRIYAQVADELNDIENYRTQTAYENNLIVKKFVFETFNNYSALAITAFFKGTYFTCTFGKNNCLADTKYLLIAIVVTRYAIAVVGVCSHGPTLFKKSGDGSKSKDDVNVANPIAEADVVEAEADDEWVDLELSGLSGAEAAMARESRKTVAELANPRFETEIELEDYEGTFDDYAEIVLQMGLVAMFSLGWYLLPLWCMIETLLQIRTDAYKLCAMTRRPDPTLAESVGSWAALMEAMGLLATFTNAGIITFTGRAFLNRSVYEKLLIFFLLQHAMLAVNAVIRASDDVPVELKEIRNRQSHVVDRHKNALVTSDGFEDEMEDDFSEQGGGRKGHIDREQLKTSGVKQATLGNVEKAQIAYLRSRQEDCFADRKIADSEYKRASKSEMLHPELGVSYSRRNPDLALGMVTLTVLEAENIGVRRNPVSAKTCRLVVHIRDSTPRNERKYEGQPGPPPTVSKPGKVPPKTADTSSDVLTSGSRIVWNQVFSLAPIKTKKAEIYIEIIDDQRRVKLGTASVALADLASQERKSLTLSISRALPGFGPNDPSAVIYVKAHFQYSKLIPIKRRIYAIIEEQRRLARDIQNIQLGHPPEHDWDFPDEAVVPREPVEQAAPGAA